MYLRLLCLIPLLRPLMLLEELCEDGPSADDYAFLAYLRRRAKTLAPQLDKVESKLMQVRTDTLFGFLPVTSREVYRCVHIDDIFWLDVHTGTLFAEHGRRFLGRRYLHGAVDIGYYWQLRDLERMFDRFEVREGLRQPTA
jgi:hypothetical protein